MSRRARFIELAEPRPKLGEILLEKIPRIGMIGSELYQAKGQRCGDGGYTAELPLARRTLSWCRGFLVDRYFIRPGPGGLARITRSRFGEGVGLTES